MLNAPRLVPHPLPAFPVGVRPARRVPASAPLPRRGAAGATRRLVLVSLALALAVAALGLRDGSAAAVEPTPARLATPRFVIAQQGDTLWSIAARLAPGSDTTELVDRLVLLNGDTVYVGQAVLLP